MQLYILSTISNCSFCGPQAHCASIQVNNFCFEGKRREHVCEHSAMPVNNQPRLTAIQQDFSLREKWLFPDSDVWNENNPHLNVVTGEDHSFQSSLKTCNPMEQLVCVLKKDRNVFLMLKYYQKHSRSIYVTNNPEIQRKKYIMNRW